MNKQSNVLQSKISAAWAALPATPPDLSLAEAITHALNNCPTCVARRAAKAASMQRYRDNKASKEKKRKKKK